MFTEKRSIPGSTEGVTLSGKRTVNGWHSGDARFDAGAEGASGGATRRKSLRQKDRDVHIYIQG